MLTVVKVGGAVAGSPAELAALAESVKALSGSRVVVHGGGAEITAWQEKLGEQTQKVTVKDGDSATVDFSFKGE